MIDPNVEAIMIRSIGRNSVKEANEVAFKQECADIRMKYQLKNTDYLPEDVWNYLIDKHDMVDRDSLTNCEIRPIQTIPIIIGC